MYVYTFVVYYFLFKQLKSFHLSDFIRCVNNKNVLSSSTMGCSVQLNLQFYTIAADMVAVIVVSVITSVYTSVSASIYDVHTAAEVILYSTLFAHQQPSPTH